MDLFSKFFLVFFLLFNVSSVWGDNYESDWPAAEDRFPDYEHELMLEVELRAMRQAERERDNTVADLKLSDTKYGQEYMGCFKDSRSPRDLPHMFRESFKMSQKFCLYHCVGYTYYGVQSATECFCGDSYGRYDQVWDSECNHECNGHHGYGPVAKDCGGNWRNAVFKRLDPALHPDYQKPYEYKGCYEDHRSRHLPKRKETHGNVKMHVFWCMYLCNGYKFFGVESASECYCGNEYGRYRTSNKCTDKCDGSDKEICGGHWKISIYSALEYNSTNNDLWSNDNN